MAKLFGKEYTKAELRKRVGDLSQVAGAVKFQYSDGKAAGTEAIEVRNGSGLRFVVLPGRGMDIAYAELNGVPFSYISKTGVVNACHYDEEDFLRSFTAGLLTTCGLTYMGAGCVDEGKTLGLHGRIANTPAYDVGITQQWQGDDFVISVRGKVREATVFGENMVLTRTITTRLGDNQIHIHDEIENVGFSASPVMVLYHFNFGFPLLSGDSVLTTNCTDVKPRDAAAEPGLGECCKFAEPTPNYSEQVFSRKAVAQSYARLENPTLGKAVELRFNGAELPYLIEWKQVGEQDYVVGLEPGTNPPGGRAAARADGTLMFLEPQQKREHSLTVVFE